MEEHKYEFIWRIENFNWRLPKIGNSILEAKCLASPNFNFYIGGDTQWYLELYPKTGRNGAFIKCLPICNEYSKDYRINCEIAILDRKNSVHAAKRTMCNFSGVFHCDFSNALEYERKKLPLQEDLVLRCILSYTESDIKTEDISMNDLEQLSLDLSSLYMSRYNFDLTLFVGEEKLFVHRTIICIRAPKFAEMLGIQEVQDGKSRVEVKNLSFSTLKVIVQYLYSGKVYKIEDSMLPELYCTANEYNLNHLKYELQAEETHLMVSTRISAAKEVFNWEIKDIMSIKNPVCELIDLKLSQFIVYFIPSSTENYKLSFKINSFPKSNEVYLCCKTFILGKEYLSEICDQTYCFEPNKLTEEKGIVSKETWTFPLNLNRNLILNRNKYVLKEKLNLQLELVITDGTKTNEIVERKTSSKRHRDDICHLPYLSNEYLDIFKAKNRPLVGGDYYDGDCYNDVNIVVNGHEVYCHKSILCARSPVFAKLLETRKLEKIEISEVDRDTVLLMVQYMYSGQLANVASIETAKLCVAAEKYQISSLIKKCLALLKNSLNIQNVCDVLVFANEHETACLTNVVFEYVKQNKTEILNSNEWKELVEKYPVLASITVSKLNEQQSTRRIFYTGAKNKTFKVVPSRRH